MATTTLLNLIRAERSEARGPVLEIAGFLRGVPCQLHSSLNGGSLEQGGIDGLMAPEPPLDADTPPDAAPPLDDTPRDP